MTQFTDLPSPLQRSTQQFFDWLTDKALPLWSTIGVDRKNGGFVEQLSLDGDILAEVRRARVVARQIFAFRSAADLGWSGPAEELVDHGVGALLSRHVSNEHLVVPRYVPADNRSEGEFDLYDQAFGLFGLAHAYAFSGAMDLQATALAILSRMRDGWSHPMGGFGEHIPPRAPLKANPHMHMLEAALAWREVSPDPRWSELANEIVSLCISHFLSPKTGALHECFEADWSMMSDSANDVVEPGHQAEWAWLLHRWNATELAENSASVVAARLMGIAEQHGVDDRQHAFINELNAELAPRDRRVRLWPQTERIKTLVVFAQAETDTERRDVLLHRLSQAVPALLRHFEHPIAGSWWEHFDPGSRPVLEPARASSLYHIMGAANELARLTGQRLR